MKLNILIKQQLYLLFTILSLIMLNINYLQAQTISVCDNGGFEQDFLYYKGFITTYEYGSDSCVPMTAGDTLAVYTQASLPTALRFEIVNSGTDALVGIDKVKFGSKAIRINSQYGHIDTCPGDWGVDKLVKEFTVTEKNRKFTVWYAVVLENPMGHDNEQPFISITCDLAPSNDLCFDAAVLMCSGYYTDSICKGVEAYDSLDVLDWACHRVNIPKSEIGNIATIEIVVADCGAGAHMGYAYIDGFCEDCDSSALGSIELDSIIPLCSDDENTICGHYTLPLICNQDWSVDSIVIPGYNIENLSIDTVNHTFCFDFLSSNFGSEDCLDVFAEAYFSDGTSSLPSISSNIIYVCLEDYGFVDTLIISECYDNGTDDNISDDYYYVTFGIRNSIGRDWDIFRDLIDPYPNESGNHLIAADTGNATITLGPFLIQEGPWNAQITIDSTFCYYELLVTPPDYCGKCTVNNTVVIDNIKCITGSPDTWSYDIMVPGTGSYYLEGAGTASSPYSKGTTNTSTITVGKVSDGCEVFKIKTLTILGCEMNFIVCPPKPCSVSCEVEARVENQSCSYSGGVVSYYVQLDVNDIVGSYECYLVTDLDHNYITNGSLPTSQNIGPFTDDIFVTIYLCGNADCTTGCTTPDCYKSIYIAKPDITRCNSPLILTNDNRDKLLKQELMVIPNPIRDDELILKSNLEFTSFEIYSLEGTLIYLDSFKGAYYRSNIDLNPGIYIMRYVGNNGKTNSFKFIKL